MAEREDVPHSRCFVVCGRSVEEETLRTAFRAYGNVQHIKVVRDKGVAYVKFDKASSAALAIENLNGAVLNNGRGPKLKVLIAEAPPTRGMPVPPKPLMMTEEVLAADPDNHPPRSRLFVVVPKTADAAVLQEELSKYDDVEYVKTDFVAPKGIVFCKHSKSSSALRAMEDICSKGTLGPYKVKCMLAEPKTRRNRMDPGLLLQQQGQLGAMGLDPTAAAAAAAAAAGYRLAGGFGGAPTPPPNFGPQMGGGYGFDARGNGMLAQQGLGVGMGAEYAAQLGLAGGGLGFGGVPGLHGSGSAASMDSLAGSNVPLGGFGSLGSLGAPAGASTPDHGGLGGSQLGTMPGSGGFHPAGPASSMGSGGSSLSTATYPPGGYGVGLSPNGPSSSGGAPGSAASPVPVSRQRLFVVVHKNVPDEHLARLFRAYPGMEYCDVKREKATGRSKGYAYVNYATEQAAAAAMADLNGIEFPPGSGYRLKVMPAEIMASAAAPAGVAPAVNGSAMRAPGATPLGGRPPRSPAVGGPVAASLVGSSGPSPAHTPLHRNLSQEIAAVQDGLSGLSLPGGLGEPAATPHSSLHHHGAAMNGDATPGSLHHTDVGAIGSGSGIASPAPAVARELMFNVG